MWTLLSLVVLGVTTVVLPGKAGAFTMGKTTLFLMGGLALLGSSWWKTPTRLGVRNLWLGLAFCWVSALFAWQVLWPIVMVPQTETKLVSFPWVFSPILPALSCWVSLLLLDALIRHTDTMERWVRCAHTLGVLAVAVALYGVLQLLQMDPFFHIGVGQVGSIALHLPITVFGNPMVTANFLAICAPLLLIFRPWSYQLGFLLCGGLVVASKSASSLLALSLGTAGFFILRRQWRVVGLLGLMGVLGVTWLSAEGRWTAFAGMSGRWEAWTRMWYIWKALAPVQGLGLGALEAAATKGLTIWPQLHNEPLQILVETGLVGFTLMVGAVGSWLRPLLRTPLTTLACGWVAAAIAYGVVALLSFPLRVAPLLLIGILIWSALSAHAHHGRDYVAIG